MRPAIGTLVRVTRPDGTTLDGVTGSEVFHAPPVVWVRPRGDLAASGEIVPLQWVRLLDEAKRDSVGGRP